MGSSSSTPGHRLPPDATGRSHPDQRAADNGIPAGRTSGLVRAGDRAADVVAFEDALVCFFLDAADLLGVPKSVAAIYAICFASAEPLSFSDINDRLEISSGSISQGLRVLREVGALKVSNGAAVTTPRIQTTARNARQRERFEPDLELRKLVLHWMEQRLQKQLRSGRDQLAAVLKGIPDDSPRAGAILRDRLHALQTWHHKAHALLPVAKVFLKLT